MKRNKLVLGLIFVIAVLLVQPRLRILLAPSWFNSALKTYLSPPSSAQEMWRAREFGSVGSFTVLGNSLPQGVFVDSFPELGTLTYDKVVKYSSNTIDSLDLILHRNDALTVASKMAQKPLVMNQIVRITNTNGVWILGIFDTKTAQYTNGYISEEEADNTDMAWIELSHIKVLPR